MKKEDSKDNNNKNILSSRTGIPNPVDIHVGKRLKQHRMLLGLSQTQIADMLGISFQQIQKYEKGTNRVSASRLVDLSNALDVNITYFFNEIPTNTLKQSTKLITNLGEEPLNEITDNPMTKRETLTLVRNYYKITDERKRRSIITLCKALAEKN